MALSDGDHRTIKAGIPPQYQPPQDARGTLSMIFLSSVDALRASTPLQGSHIRDAVDAVDRHNLGLGFIGGDFGEAAPSFILTGAQAASVESHLKQTEERKRDDERFTLDRFKAALDAHLAALDAELAAIDKRLEEIRQRRAEIGDRLEAMDDLERLAATGKLDPNNNPAHRRLLQKTGITPEQARQGSAADLIAQRRQALGAEDTTLDAEWNTRMRRRAEVVRDREEILIARKEIENEDSPEAIVRSEAMKSAVTGRLRLGEAAYSAESDAAKVIAADAVGVSAKSKLFNRNAALNTDEFYAASDEIKWDDGPTPPVTMKP